MKRKQLDWCFQSAYFLFTRSFWKMKRDRLSETRKAEEMKYCFIYHKSS